MSRAASYTRRSKACSRSLSSVTKERSTPSPPSKATMPSTAARTDVGGADSRTAPGTRASSRAAVRRSSTSGSWIATTPRSDHATPQRPIEVPNRRKAWAAVQWSEAVTGERTVLMGTQRLRTASREALGYTAMMASRIAWRKWRSAVRAEDVFAHLFGESDPAFWLDSASSLGDLSRFSFMGNASGPHAEVVTYDVESRLLSIAHGDQVETRSETVFSYLERRLGDLRVAAAGLPFPFDLGYVGYLGYELKVDCGASTTHRASTPDAALLLAD